MTFKKSVKGWALSTDESILSMPRLGMVVFAAVVLMTNSVFPVASGTKPTPEATGNTEFVIKTTAAKTTIPSRGMLKIDSSVDKAHPFTDFLKVIGDCENNGQGIERSDKALSDEFYFKFEYISSSATSAYHIKSERQNCNFNLLAATECGSTLTFIENDQGNGLAQWTPVAVDGKPNFYRFELQNSQAGDCQGKAFHVGKNFAQHDAAPGYIEQEVNNNNYVYEFEIVPIPETGDTTGETPLEKDHGLQQV